MHKKVQSLLITGVLSANMVGSTVAVFADDIKKENGIKTEEAAKPNGEKDIDWQTTDDSNYDKLWEFSQGEGNTIILRQYKGAKGKSTGSKEKNVEIPRTINGQNVVLENLNTATFPNVERIRVSDGKGLIGLKSDNLFEAFINNKNLKYIDLSGIDVSKVTNIVGFLEGASELKEVNLSGWNLSNVNDLQSFLSETSNLEKANLSDWDVSNVTNMQALFYQAKELKTVDISGWKESKELKNTRYMFGGCSKLESIDLSTLNMDNVTNAESMFQNCSSLTKIKGTEKWTLNRVEKIQSMFRGTKLNFIDLSKCNLPDNLDLDKMSLVFGDSQNIKNLLIVTNDKKLEKYKFENDSREAYRIIFDTDGGKFNNGQTNENINTIIITTDKAKLLGTPIKEGFEFESWGDLEGNKLTAKWKTKVIQGEGTKPGVDTEKPEVDTEKPGVDTEKPGVDTEKPGVDTEKPEVDTEKPEVDTEKPGVDTEKPGVDTEKPEVDTEKPGVDTEKPGEGTEKPEVKPENPGGGTNNDNTPVLDGTDKDNIMIHPLECLPSVYTLVDENMVSITQRGDGTENNPVILQVKDSIYKVDLDNFINKFDTLNSNVSTITRSDKYTEYKMTVDNKNLNDPTKSKTTNVILRINNTKLDLLKAANRYSRRRNYDVKIPIIVKFNDVKDNFWGRSYIEDFASMGIVDGYPNNEFKPNNSITRAEFVRIINNAFGYTKPIDNVKFNDVEKNSWYYNDIAIGLEQGYINGRSETTFSPNDNITREEVAMILTNIMKNKDNDFNRLNNFNDGNKTSDWAKSAMAGAIKAGYLIGDDQKNLSPTKNMTRAEAIASLSRVRPVK